MGSAIPHATFGVAMTEGSDHRLIRSSGNDDHLAALAAKLAYELGCGHIFLVLFEGAFPLQVLPSLRAVPTVLQIFAATGNPSIVLVAQLQEQGAILGVADGYSPLRRETSDERVSRRGAIRRFGYAEPD